MSASGSKKVIIIALSSNLAIALAKVAGAFFTKSASMLAEGIHSFADCANQVFLLIGAKQSAKPADELHPLGYGRESFFWSFMVALLLFTMGGVFAIYEGVHKFLGTATEITNPIVGFSILIISIALEAASFTACLREVRQQNRYSNLWTWFRKSTASDLIVIFIEDLAALVGLIIAMIFMLLSVFTKNHLWDATGSVLIGLVLVTVAILLGLEIKSLLVGEKAGHDYRDFIIKNLKSKNHQMSLLNVISIATGSHEVMLAMKIHPGTIQKSDDLINEINELEVGIKKEFPEVRWLFVEPDFVD